MTYWWSIYDLNIIFGQLVWFDRRIYMGFFWLKSSSIEVLNISIDLSDTHKIQCSIYHSFLWLWDGQWFTSYIFINQFTPLMLGSFNWNLQLIPITGFTHLQDLKNENFLQDRLEAAWSEGSIKFDECLNLIS